MTARKDEQSFGWTSLTSIATAKKERTPPYTHPADVHPPLPSQMLPHQRPVQPQVTATTAADVSHKKNSFLDVLLADAKRQHSYARRLKLLLRDDVLPKRLAEFIARISRLTHEIAQKAKFECFVFFKCD